MLNVLLLLIILISILVNNRHINLVSIAVLPMDKKNNERKSDNFVHRIVSAIVYAVITACIIALFIPGYLYAKKDKWQHRCKCALFGLGLKQRDYSSKYNSYFGSFEDLQRKDYINGEYNRDNYIDKYHLIEFTDYPSITSKEPDKKMLSTFTIVAVPFEKYRKLKTFAINQDYIVVCWKGNDTEFNLKTLSLSNRKQWEVAKVNCEEDELR